MDLDTTSSRFPGAAEICDGLDNDCNLLVDDNAVDALTWNGDDCNDSSAQASPSGVEIRDGIDNNCAGFSDEPGTIGEQTWYVDADGEGYGDASTATSACNYNSGGGGFGGGGGTYHDNSPGRGGGYSGGGGGYNGAGGGSYNSGTNTSSQVGSSGNTGDGYVILTLL